MPAQYTTELRTLINSGLITENQLFAALNIDCTEAESTELKTLIINHFYLREIGAETPDRFLHYFNDVLRIHCPEYNRLYNALKTELDLFSNEQYKMTIEAHQTGEKEGETTHEINTEEKGKDTPFTQVLSPSTDYMSKYGARSESDTISLTDSTAQNAFSTTNFNGLKGKTFAEAFNDYRKNIITINNLWLGWLEDCFMRVF